MFSFESGPGVVFKSYTLSTPPGASGTFHQAGYYNAPVADSNLTQASTTQTLGAANVPYAAHAFLVAKQAGTATGGTGAVTIVVTGTSITDGGTRNASGTETIVTSIAAMSANEYFETALKWIGQVTFTLTVGATGHTAYAADFNYGFCKYEDFGNRPFTVTDLEIIGVAGADDAGIDFELLHHKATGWTFNDGAFVPGTTALKKMSTIHSTESDVDNSLPFAFKVAGMTTSVDGANSEGLVVRVTTTANNAIEFMDTHIGVQI